MQGNIHSIESFGSIDGPGIRLVVFFQGCPMRCLYCHNPDTWDPGRGTSMSTDEILELYEKNKTFYKGGGITATGGEPMLQIDFLTELFRKAKQKNIHTCLDTSGITFPLNTDSAVMKKIDGLLDVTDLVMLDIKHINDEMHKRLTGHSNQRILGFLEYLDLKKIPTWIRHVIVPSWTDDPAFLMKLGYELGRFGCIKALDVLPYHSMGEVKYEQLKMEYPLKGTPDKTKHEAQEARLYILKGMKKRRDEG